MPRLMNGLSSGGCSNEIMIYCKRSVRKQEVMEHRDESKTKDKEEREREFVSFSSWKDVTSSREMG